MTNPAIAQLLESYEGGTLTATELYVRLMVSLPEDIESVLYQLPSNLRQGFLQWARHHYGPGIDISTHVPIGGEASLAIPTSAIESLRSWLQRRQS